MLDWTIGKQVQTVDSITLASNTALTSNKTVPAGKRWLLLNIKITNPDNVTRLVTITKFKEAALTNVIKVYETLNVGAGARLNVPNLNVADNAFGVSRLPFPDILEGGNIISIEWAAGGVSAGGVDADGLALEYLEIDA